MGAKSIRRWLIIGATVLVAVISVSLIAYLQAQADRAERIQVNLLRIQERMNALSTLEWQLIAGEDVSEVSSRITLAEKEMDASLGRLLEESRFDLKGQQLLTNVEIIYRKYIDAVHIEVNYLKSGQVEKADTIDEQRVDPAFEELIKGTESTYNYYLSSALRWGRIAKAGTIVVAVAAVVLFITLFLQFNKLREVSLKNIWEQQALSRSEELYRGLVELTPDAVFIQSDGRCLFVNDAGVKMMGATSEEDVLGETILNDVEGIDNQPQTARTEMQLARIDGKTVDIEVTRVPFKYEGKDAVQIVAHDITERKQAKEIMERDLQIMREQREKIFKVYRDVIYAVTQGKFNLLDRIDLEEILEEGALCFQTSISSPGDVSMSRQLMKDFLQDFTFTQQQTMFVLLCISETTTNVIKHAERGIMQVRRLADKIRVIIRDDGPGMDFDKLPNMIFLEGYSTKISMGYGFSIVFKLADFVYLFTADNGTAVVLDFNESTCPEAV